MTAERFFKAILLALTVVFVSGCRQMPDRDTDGRYVIGFSQCTDDLWRQIMMVQMKAEAAKYPEIELVVKNAYGNTSVQIGQIQEFLDMNVDLLIVSPNESEAVTPLAVKAYDSGIPTIIWDRKIMSDHYTTFIGADNYKIGGDVGRYIKSILPAGSTILEITGLMSSSPAEERHKGFIAEAGDKYSIYSVSGDWMPGSARDEVLKIRNYEDIDLIFAHNDDMALSAYDAVASVDRESAERISFIGIDALVGVDAVLDGRLSASFLYPTGGDKVMSMAYRILSGAKVEKRYDLATALVDKNNAFTLKAQQEQIFSYQEQINEQEKNIIEYGRRFRSLKSSMVIVLVLAMAVIAVSLYALRLNIRLKRKNGILAAKNAEIEKATSDMLEKHAQIESRTAERLNFFTNITHEIRTPLTLILNPLDNILKKEKDLDLQHDIWIVQRNARHLLKIVNQILDLRKVENHKSTLSLSEIDIVLFVREILTYFEVYAKTEKITCKFSSGISGQMLWIDKDKIEQVFLNLLSNAFKYSHKYGIITVSITDNGPSVLIEVEDNGKGIEKENLPRVFDRFYSLGKSGNYSTGIGLHLTKEYVEMHKGKITVDSIPDNYTVFRVELFKGREHFGPETPDTKFLPAAHENVFPGESIDESKVREMIGRKYDYTVLIAEDDADILAYLSRELSENFSLISVSNGYDALKSVRDDSVSLVLSDVLMPGLNGFQLCSAIKSDISTSHLPVVLLTALSEPDYRLYGLAEGADAYISKPFDMVFLKVKLIRILEERRKMAETFSRKFSRMMVQDISELPCQDELFKKKVFDIFEEEYDNSEFKIDAMSGKLGISRISLYRKISSLFGLTPSDLLRNFRLRKSLSLLSSGKANISEVAYTVGFSSPAYFAKCFKALYGMTPTEYMNGGKIDFSSN